jgi:uncharacterized protein (TIGR02271 family)
LAEDDVHAAVIPVFEEELRVDKREKEVDRLLIRTKIQEKTDYAELDLYRGEAVVERVPVNRIVDAAPAVREDGDTIVIPVLEEIMVVEKRLLLKEEIRIRRQTTIQHVRQPVRLRSEEVSLERDPPRTPTSNLAKED